MKPIYFLLLLFAGTTCLANEIDKLQTNAEVNHFLAKRVDKGFKENPILDESPNMVSKTEYGFNTFFKIDIDQNGLTDLIVSGLRNLMVVLDNGKGEYLLRELDDGVFSMNHAELISLDTASSPHKMVIQQHIRPDKQYDTLIFKFNNFIEYNAHPDSNFVFDKITFKAEQCFGTCPVFEMTVDKDQSATYKAILYNPEKGEFTGRIPTRDFKELISLLKYLSPENLRKDYKVRWTDDQTVTTTITHNGMSKTISDYGAIGTHGLRCLYTKFFLWRDSIKWSE